MRTKWRGIRIATVLGLITSGAWSAGGEPYSPTDTVQLAQASKVYEFKLAASLSATDPFTKRQAQMVARIKERTQSAVVITMYPGDTLLKARDAPKELARGTIEMTTVGVDFFAGVSDIAAILNPGFVGISVKDSLRVLEPGSEGRKIVDEEFTRLNTKALAFWNQTDIGFVTFSPLNTVESFRGKRLRVSGEIANRVIRALGAEPTVMGGAEAVDSMRRRIIEGSSCQPTCIVSRGYMDFANYYNTWTVEPLLGMVAINLNVWNGMPENLRKIIQEEADAAAKDQTNLVATVQGQTMWMLAYDYGLSLLAIKPEEAAKLRAIAKPVFDDFVKKASPQPQATRLAKLLMEAAEKK